LGIFTAAQTRPMMASQKVTTPNDIARLENVGAVASEIVEYSLLLTRYPWPVTIASNRLGARMNTATSASRIMPMTTGMTSVQG